MITPTSWAAGVGAAVENVQFSTRVSTLQRKHLLIGAPRTTVTLAAADEYVPVRIASAAEAGALYGFGGMLHRMAIHAFRGNQGACETWALPCPPDVSAAVATETVVFGGAAATEAGEITIYIGSEPVTFAVAIANTVTDIGDAFEAAVNANINLPVTANNMAGTVTLTAKTGGTWGNQIRCSMFRGLGEEIPAPITVTLPASNGFLTAGATDPDVDAALVGLGTGDDANALHFTDVNIGWGSATAAVLNAISTYVGPGNDAVGLYSNVIGRPFRVLHGNTTSPLATLTAAADAAARRLDRANGVLAAPDARVHEVDLACQALGVIARQNHIRAEAHALDTALVGVDPGDPTGGVALRWTDEYAHRDTAVQGGVGTTAVKAGSLVIQNLLTWYRPAAVPIESNGYRSMRNISIVQNMLHAVRTRFDAPRWKGITIVADVAAVGSVSAREKTRDLAAVTSELMSLADAFEALAWIFSGAFTKDRLAAGGLVTIRTGGNGFDGTLPVLFSGEAGIFNTLIQFDTALDVAL